MVKSTAKANILYRGFVIKVHATKESGGRKSVHTHINHHVPELKPKYAKQIDKRKTIQTSEGEIECMRAYDTFGPIEADKLTCSQFYKPKYDSDDSNSLISRIPIIGSRKSDTPPALSTMVRETLSQTQTNIDNYIANHAIVEIDAEEFRHGIEQTAKEPMDSVEVNTPEMNTESDYDAVRPEPTRIAKELTE